MNKIEKLIYGSAIIFMGTLALFVTTPKEGFEIIQPVPFAVMILVGVYINYNAIYGK